MVAESPKPEAFSVAEPRKAPTMAEWEAERFGTPLKSVTTQRLQEARPRRRDLAPAPFLSRLGGRVRHRLRPWPETARARDLVERAKRFLAEAPDKPADY